IETQIIEYKDNIKYILQSNIILLNLEEDYLDYYEKLVNIIHTFKEYLRNQDENSKTILNLNEENNKLILDAVQGELITYGQENPEADYNATNITLDEIGRPSFDLIMENGSVEHFKLGVIGRHNINNAMASIIATYENGIDINTIRDNIVKYTGLDRRMQILGYVNKDTIMTDYG